VGFSGDRSTRCLITGGSSPLGAALARRLADAGENVAVLVRPSSNCWRLEGLQDRIMVLYGDMEDIDRSASQIRAFAPEIVFHAAWHGVRRESRQDPAQITVNVPGTLRLLEIALDAGLRTWIGVGSQAEYGPQNCKLHEDIHPRPNTAYGAAKLAAGQLTLERCRLAGVDAAWLRLLATCGPADEETRLIPYLIRTLHRGETAHLSAGSQAWDYLYIEDAAGALVSVAASSARGVYNLASGAAWPVRRIAGYVRQLIGSGQVEFADTPAPASLEADVSRLIAATGWRPSIGMEEALQRTVAWYLSREAATAPIFTAEGA